jgi:hypothetical protein
VLSFDVQGICNGCETPPRPIPILCADNITQSQSQSQTPDPGNLEKRAAVEAATAEEAPRGSESEHEQERVSFSSMMLTVVAFGAGIGIVVVGMVRMKNNTGNGAEKMVSKRDSFVDNRKAHQSDGEKSDYAAGGLSDSSDGESDDGEGERGAVAV